MEYLTYTVDETPRNYDAIQLTVGYRRTAAQVAGIVHITSTSALGDLLREAARNHAAELVVQVGYFDHQAEEVRTGEADTGRGGAGKQGAVDGEFLPGFGECRHH